MLRRQVTGGFVCLRCRLTQLGSASVARQRHFSASAPARNERHALERQAIIDALSGLDQAPKNTDSSKTAPPTRAHPPPNERRNLQSHDANDGWDEVWENGENDHSIKRESHGWADSSDAPLDTPFLRKTYGSHATARDREGTDGDRNQSDPASFPLSADQKMFKLRGKRVQPKMEGLTIDILGMPGAALVLRDKGAFKKNPLGVLKEEEAAKSDLSLAETVDKENSLPGLTEALLNIHELRPSDTQTLSEKDFAALKDSLAVGFTKKQLMLYILNHHNEARSKQGENQEESLPLVADPPWILERRPWIPVAMEGIEATGDSQQGYISKSMTPKERIAVRLMRECWDLSSHTVLETLGRLEVRLRDTEFALLLIGSQKWLQRVSRTLLDTGNRMELFCASNTISVMAPQVKAEAVIRRINDVLARTKTVNFSTDLISAEPMDQTLLEDVGRITHTLIRHDPASKQVSVTWINLPPPAKGMEDLGDVVLRYLLEAFHPKIRTSSALTVLHNDLTMGGRYVTKYGCEPQLPWYKRREQWSRWVVPTGAIKSKRHIPVIPTNFLPHPMEIKGLNQTPAPRLASSTESQGWSPRLQTDTRAVFGHIVHAKQHPLSPSSPITPVATPASGTTTTPTVRATLDPFLQRTFIPLLPPIQALDFPTNLREEGLWHSILVLRFTPAPTQPQQEQHEPPPPPLELRIEADHHEIKQIISLRAIASSFVGDVLLPSAPVDVRLVQDRYVELPGPAIDNHAPAVLEFLRIADLRPWHGKLATPPRLNGLRLPRRLLRLPGPGPSSADPTDKPASEAGESEPAAVKPEEDDNDLVDVDYVFASLEIQRAVATECEGFKLAYRSTEAGQRGGKNAELSLDAVAVEGEKELGAEAQTDAEADAGADTDAAADVNTDAHANAKDSDVAGPPASSDSSKCYDAESFMAAVSKLAFMVVNRRSRFGWQGQEATR